MTRSNNDEVLYTCNWGTIEESTLHYKVYDHNGKFHGQYSFLASAKKVLNTECFDKLEKVLSMA